MPLQGELATKNWQAIKYLARKHLAYLRERHSAWSMQDLFRELQVPMTPLLEKIALESGFTSAPQADFKTDAPHSITAPASQGYGQAPFGVTSYGGSRCRSDGKIAVIRKVTRAGQLYYRGYRYTLGIAYGNRHAVLLERGPRIKVTFEDRPPLELAARHWVAS